MAPLSNSRRGPDDTGRMVIAMVALLVVAFLFGGASRTNVLRVALVELAALPLIVLAGLAMLRSEAWQRHRFALSIAGLAAAIPLLQLIPLPAFVWTALPGREPLVQALEVTGVAPGWGVISLTPDFTWRAFLALLPPLAMFAATLLTPHALRRKLVWLVLALSLAAILLATAQVATSNEALYPYSWTDPGLAVGFFANRNHMAALCNSTLPFAAALAASGLVRDRSRQADLTLGLGIAFVALAIIAVGAIRSRAGIGIVGPSLVAGLLAAWVGSGRGRLDLRTVAMAGFGIVAIGVVATFGLGPIIERFESLPSREGRFEEWPYVIDAAQTYLPLGSGLGSFNSVYRSVEALEVLSPYYFNNAHNDFLEIWLETGWLGIGLLIAFFVWFGRRGWAAWRGGPSPARNMERAATIAIVVILAHSTVDYPLRTELMMVWFALCCGILELAARSATDEREDRTHRA